MQSIKVDFITNPTQQKSLKTELKRRRTVKLNIRDKFVNIQKSWQASAIHTREQSRRHRFVLQLTQNKIRIIQIFVCVHVCLSAHQSLATTCCPWSRAPLHPSWIRSSASTNQSFFVFFNGNLVNFYQFSVISPKFRQYEARLGLKVMSSSPLDGSFHYFLYKPLNFNIFIINSPFSLK